MSLRMVALIAATACGQTERELPATMTTGGAAVTSDAGGAGAVTSGAGAAGAVTSGAVTSGAGASGAGGVFEVQSAVAECERYCETSRYRLPQALCEDWSRFDWDPPFCHLDATTSCPDYCSNVYEAVTPACAALLQPVVRCVAPSYASGSLPPCWLAECYPELLSLTSACYGLREKLAVARATWQASGVVDYELTYEWSNSEKAQVVVRAGLEPAVTPANATAWTVPALFDLVEHYLHVPGVAPIVTYEADLGHVVDLSLLQTCGDRPALASAVEVAPLR